MPAVIVVDNELKDSVKEYGQIIDSVNESVELSKTLQSFFNDQSKEIVDKPGLIKKIYETSTASNLTKLSDREFEPTFNLITYILSQLEGSFEKVLNKDSQVIQNLIECNPTKQPLLRDRKSIKSTTILSILNTFFNFLPETSSNRIHILTTILNTVEASNIDYSLIQEPIGNSLVLWLTQANATDEEIKSIFWKFINLDDKKSYKSLQLIKSFTSKHTLNLNELHKLIKFALLSSTTDVSFLVNNTVGGALKENSSDELVSLFTKYTRGELITSVPSSSGLSSEDVEQKSRILALGKYFIDNDNKNVFNYNEIPTALASSAKDFESLLINSIKAGVIEGKLNQVDQTFYLTRVHRFIIAGDEESVSKNWENVKNALVDWKNSLANIDDIVNTSRENIVNNNNN